MSRGERRSLIGYAYYNRLSFKSSINPMALSKIFAHQNDSWWGLVYAVWMLQQRVFGEQGIICLDLINIDRPSQIETRHFFEAFTWIRYSESKVSILLQYLNIGGYSATIGRYDRIVVVYFTLLEDAIRHHLFPPNVRMIDPEARFIISTMMKNASGVIP